MNNSKSISSFSEDNVYHTVFALLKSALWGEERYPAVFPQDTDWTSIYQELRHQAVSNLPLDILCRVDATHKASYIHASLSRFNHYFIILKEQQNLYELLKQNEIPCAILKGSSAARYYPTPSYRSMGDVDLIVRPEDYQHTFDLMLENGFVFDAHGDIRHAHCKRNGVYFELHRYYTQHNTEEQAAFLDNRIFEGLNHTTLISLDGFVFPTLPDMENGLIFLEHICHHIESGLGLRQIIDWMMFVDATLDDETWHTQYQNILKFLGYETLAITVTRMCQIYLGLREDITWCKDADINLTKELLNTFIESGNFGRKQDAHTTNSIKILIDIKNVSVLFPRLQYRGTLNWKSLEKHPWLKPFAWFYQICRYIRKGFSQDQPLRHLFQNIKKSRQKDSLLDRLEIPRRSRGEKTILDTNLQDK